MIVIRPFNFKRYSQCPQRSKFSWNIKPEDFSLHQQIISDTIKTIYLYAEKKEKVASWKQVPGWVDRLIRKQPETAAELYNDYKEILTALNKWFHQEYLSHPSGGLVNVPIVAHLPSQYTIYGQVDILSIDEKALYIFSIEKDAPAVVQYNDIEMFSLLWMTERYLGEKIDICVKLTILPQSIKEKRYHITEETRKRAHHIFNHLLKGITNNIFYPSISEQCSSCSYRYRCSI